MTYTQIGILAVTIAIALDLIFLRTAVLKRAVWWISYTIVVFFQFITNGTLTGFAIVQYDPKFNIGENFYSQTPPLIGDGRLFFAPVEDLLFGFAMCLSAVAFWIYLGKLGVQREPVSNTSNQMRQRFKFLR
jgi:hypothetical protein